MNLIRKIAKFSILYFLAMLIIPIPTFAEEKPTQTIDIEQYAENMQPGWNLGNTYDAVGEDETAWGNPMVTRELIQQIADEGFQSIRIPITFDGRMSTDGNYQIEEEFLSRIQQTVDWSLEEDLHVMINVHHDSWIWLQAGMQDNHDQTVERFRHIWVQLSDRFKDYPIELMFESINEPQFTGTESQQQAYLDELNDVFHDVVRNSGGNNDIRPIVLPTLLTGQEPERVQALYQYIENLNDPHVIATVHYYGFWPFSVNIAGVTRFNEETRNDIDTIFDRVYHQFTANGIPVVIGEYGLLGFDTGTDVIQQGEKLKYFEYMIPAAQDNSFVHMLWDNGQHLNRHTLQWNDSEFSHMLTTSWRTRSAVPNNNFIYLHKKEDLANQSIRFQLNGHSLEQVLLNDQLLVVEEDYSFENNSLKIKKELLESILVSEETGKLATLQVIFSDGFNWSIPIYQNDTPILESSNGTVSDFKIPVSFQESHVATMEAHYEDGSIAGPQNWTSFKEYGYTFSPNYEDGHIELTEKLFHEIDENRQVTLTFYFWGNDQEEQIQYIIQKTGTDVTGSPLLKEEETTPDDLDTDPERGGDEGVENNESENSNEVDQSNSDHNEGKEEIEDNVDSSNNENNEEEQDHSGSLIGDSNPPAGDSKLPNTATLQYTWLFIGSLCIIGSAVFFYLNKREFKIT